MVRVEILWRFLGGWARAGISEHLGIASDALALAETMVRMVIAARGWFSAGSSQEVGNVRDALLLVEVAVRTAG